MNRLGVLVTAAATCLFFKGGAAEETCWEQESSTDTCTEGCWFDDGWTYDTCETCSSGSDDPNNECDVGQQSGYSPNCYVMDSSSVGCCSGFRESGISINGVVHCIRNGMDDQLNGGTRDGLYCGSQSSFTNVCNIDEEDKCMGETKKAACYKISGCRWYQEVCQMAASEPADVCMAETKAGKCRKTSGCLWKNGECLMVAEEQTGVCAAETKAGKCRKISGCRWKNGECLVVAEEQTDVCVAETKKGKCRKISGCVWKKGECLMVAEEQTDLCEAQTEKRKCHFFSYGCQWSDPWALHTDTDGRCLNVCDNHSSKEICKMNSGCRWKQGKCDIIVCMGETKAGKCRDIVDCLWQNGQCILDLSYEYEQE